MADSLQEQTADTAVQAAPQLVDSPSDELQEDTQLAANPSSSDVDAHETEACDATTREDNDDDAIELGCADAVESKTRAVQSQPNPKPDLDELEIIPQHTLRADESTAPLDPVPVLQQNKTAQEDRESARSDSGSQTDEVNASHDLDPLVDHLEKVDASPGQRTASDTECPKSAATNLASSSVARELTDAQPRDRSSEDKSEQRVNGATKTPSERDRPSAATETSDETVTFQRRRKGKNIRRPTPNPAHPVIAQPGQRWWSDHFELSTWLGRGLWWMSFALAYVGMKRLLDPFSSDTALAQVPYLAGAGWICAIAILGSTIPKRFRFTALALGIAHSALLAVAWVWRLDLLR